MRRIIREEEPPQPEHAAEHDGDDAADASRPTASSEPTKLSELVRGELDWIVMKALEKDRTRRYETANGLAADVQRYLNNEPVVARPPSRLYRLRKLARRHQGAVLAAAAVAGLSWRGFGDHHLAGRPGHERGEGRLESPG